MKSKKFTENVVSIVTPVYNGETFLSRYLEAILKQTYGSLELILVDDGSADRTVQTAKSYRSRLEQRGRLQMKREAIWTGKNCSEISWREKCLSAADVIC